MGQKITISCSFCGKIYFKSPSKALKHNRHYCSHDCLQNYQKSLQIEGSCVVCKKIIWKSKKVLEKSKHKLFFCSSSCSAIYSNKNRKKDKNCDYCGKIINRPNSNYCSQKCFHLVKKEKTIKEWKMGLISGMTGKKTFHMKASIRKYLLELNDYKCSKCGWGEKNNFTNLIPLSIHHVDGNASNDTFDNLQVLCPNCHSLTSNYGSRNKNSARTDRNKTAGDSETP
jgi:predicted nucleic acid-binding Zn ribbon protein